MMQSTEQLKLCLRGLQRQSHFDASQAIGWRGLYTRPRKGDIFLGLSCISLWELPDSRPGSHLGQRGFPGLQNLLSDTVTASKIASQNNE